MDSFWNAWDGPSTVHAAQLLFPMREEVDRRIKMQAREERRAPSEAPAFDLAAARIHPSGGITHRDTGNPGNGMRDSKLGMLKDDLKRRQPQAMPRA